MERRGRCFLNQAERQNEKWGGNDPGEIVHHQQRKMLVE
jgi:hypothetical protein